jgi:O-antigen/teichoic acid export membrane protein
LILTGHQRLWLRLAFGSLLSNIVLCMLLIPRLGIVGAALSTAISLNAMYILAIFRARTVVGAWPYDRRYLKGAIASLACVCLLFAARTFFGGTEALLLGALIVVSGVTFPTVLLSLGLDAEDESVARTALKRVLSRK